MGLWSWILICMFSIRLEFYSFFGLLSFCFMCILVMGDEDDGSWSYIGTNTEGSRSNG